MKSLTTFYLLIISLSLTSSELYLKQKDWEWKELPSIFDLNSGLRQSQYGRSDRLVSQGWSWTESEGEEEREREGEGEREVFRASEVSNNTYNPASGFIKKTSRLAPLVSE